MKAIAARIDFLRDDEAKSWKIVAKRCGSTVGFAHLYSLILSKSAREVIHSFRAPFARAIHLSCHVCFRVSESLTLLRMVTLMGLTGIVVGIGVFTSTCDLLSSSISPVPVVRGRGTSAVGILTVGFGAEARALHVAWET